MFHYTWYAPSLCIVKSHFDDKKILNLLYNLHQKLDIGSVFKIRSPHLILTQV